MSNIIVINSESMGKGDEELGRTLMGAFLRKLWAQEKKPAYIILYNSAVKLIAEGSSSLDAMDGLYSAGVDIIACGTCVEYYQLKGGLKIGRISSMDEICALLMEADKVITI
ncbi:MAG: sulfurtransferase-like selenium metabolism protein YedF [Anaerocolumna sp.]